MTDFSHLFADKVALVSRHVELGLQATDEMLLEAVQQFDDDVLQPGDRSVVEDVLTRKQGRPLKAKALRCDVAQRIEAICHPAMPRPLQDALAHRLRRSHGLTEWQCDLRAHKAVSKLRRDQHIRFLYRQVYRLLSDAPMVDLPIFGAIAVPNNVQKSPRRDKAAEITAGLLRQLGFDPPAKGRIFNIISKK
jgi:hypothetical protein